METDRPPHILLVEDHADLREVTADLLESAGYSVTAVGDVRSAYHALSSDEFDVVICDLRLGRGSGYDVLHATRDGSGPPAIALSAESDEDTIRRSLAAGFAAHVPKGTPFDDLCETIDRVRKAA